jgi:hypothetical protein
MHSSFSKKYEWLLFWGSILIIVALSLWSIKSSNSPSISDMSPQDIQSAKQPESESITDNDLNSLQNELPINPDEKITNEENVKPRFENNVNSSDDVGFGGLRILALSANLPISANVFVGGIFRGSTDNEGRLFVREIPVNDSYEVRVSKKGFKEWKTKIDIVKNESSEIIANLLPLTSALGSFMFLTMPNIDSIFVDGKYLDKSTPFLISSIVGWHNIVIKNKIRDIEWDTTVFLGLNENKIIEHQFDELKYGYLSVTVSNALQYGYGYVHIDGKLWQDNESNTTPLRLKLPVGLHQIEVKREDFFCIPADTSIFVDENTEKLVSFRLELSKN